MPVGNCIIFKNNKTRLKVVGIGVDEKYVERVKIFFIARNPIKSGKLFNRKRFYVPTYIYKCAIIMQCIYYIGICVYICRTYIPEHAFCSFIDLHYFLDGFLFILLMYTRRYIIYIWFIVLLVGSSLFKYVYTKD